MADTDMTDEQQRNDLVRKTCDSLAEHFDSVVIIATFRGHGTTSLIKEGAGNLYAQIQSAREFVEAMQAQTHFEQAPIPPPDASEDWRET
jgi:hypothetical protein